MRDTLGAFCQEFVDIITSSIAIDADCLILNGQLTKDAALLYIRSSEDHDMCNQLLLDLAVKITNSWRPQLLDLVRCDVNKKTYKSGLNFKLKQLILLVNAKADKRVICYAENIKFFNNTFLSNIFTIVGADLITLQKKQVIDNLTDQIISEHLSTFREIMTRVRGDHDAWHLLYSERIRCQAFFSKFNSQISHLLDKVGAQKITLDERLEFCLALRDEGVYRDMSFVSLHNDDNLQIVFLGNKPDDNYITKHLVYIDFNKVMTELPESRYTDDNALYIEIPRHENNLCLQLNLETGQLSFFSVPLPITDYVDADLECRLTDYVLSRLYKFIIDSESIIVDPLIKEMSLNEITGEETCINTNEEYVPYTPSEKNNQPIIEGESLESIQTIELKFKQLPKQKSKLVFNRIKNANPSVLLTAIERLLGSSARKNSTSHHVFTSERTGASMAIPSHSRREVGRIRSDIVFKALRIWGYDPVELARELGLKI